jgi:hypothetical protein
VPPRWNLRDWQEEIDAECIATACHAIGIFDPNQRHHLGYFVYHQILASARSRYRAEGIYAARFSRSSDENADPAGPDYRFRIDMNEEQLKRAFRVARALR